MSARVTFGLLKKDGVEVVLPGSLRTTVDDDEEWDPPVGRKNKEYV